MELSPIDAVFAIPELFTRILGFLNLGDVPAIRRTCRAWGAAKFRVRCGPADRQQVEDRVYQLVTDNAGPELKAALAQVDPDTATHYARNMLVVAAGYGRLEIAQWLADHFGFTAGDARMADNWALRIACGRGYLEAAQWLTSHFKLVLDDARADGNWALREACANGHLRTAQWLVNHFELATTDAQSRDSEALSRACTNDDLNTVQWLVDRFEFTDADAQDAVYQTTCAKSGAHRLKTVCWLQARFRLC